MLYFKHPTKVPASPWKGGDPRFLQFKHQIQDFVFKLSWKTKGESFCSFSPMWLFNCPSWVGNWMKGYMPAPETTTVWMNSSVLSKEESLYLWLAMLKLDIWSCHVHIPLAGRKRKRLNKLLLSSAWMFYEPDWMTWNNFWMATSGRDRSLFFFGFNIMKRSC